MATVRPVELCVWNYVNKDEDQFFNVNIGSVLGHEVAQLIEAQRYKAKVCGVDSRWGSLNSIVG